jgi:GNAT superfamily N-acetyltransferase
MEYLIRKAEEGDLPALIELCRKHALHENAFYSTDHKSALLSSALFTKSPKLYCYVVEIQSRIAGYYSYTFDFSTWDAKAYLHLDCLYLEPLSRGMKIGATVFEHLKKIATENNCVNIQWQTPAFNHNAIKFYERMGGISISKQRFTLNI